MISMTKHCSVYYFFFFLNRQPSFFVMVRPIVYRPYLSVLLKSRYACWPQSLNGSSISLIAGNPKKDFRLSYSGCPLVYFFVSNKIKVLLVLEELFICFRLILTVTFVKTLRNEQAKNIIFIKKRF
jgi:hypothetical protein